MESFTIWTTLALYLTAAGLALFQSIEHAALIITLVVPITLGYIFKTRREIRRFSGEVLNSRNTMLATALSAAREHISDQQLTIKQIIRSLDEIGSSDKETGHMHLDGEAGVAITTLQRKLDVIKEEETQRFWSAQGLNQVSEIRQEDASIADYGYQIISHLVKFLGSNQGVFYIRQEEGDQSYLELLATYAYGKRKFNHERITLEIGTGQVGQCALEGSMLMMTDVPNDYVRITSGLGESLPRCIVIAPLVFRQQVFGVIEIASFQKFLPHHVEFIKKACDMIGLELSGIRTQERTRKLLEQSQEQELRRNLEEMRETQRQMLIKEDQLSNQLVTIQRAMAMADSERKKNEAILEGCMDAVISFSQDGVIVFFNRAAEEVFGTSRQEISGKDIRNLLDIQITMDPDGTARVVNATGTEVSLRTEINTTDKKGEDLSLLLTATKVKVESQYLFTLFAQRVSVELF
jgi:PAS domain S-box-containing protein